MTFVRLTAAALAVAFASGAADAAQLTFVGTGATQVLANNDLGLGLNGQTIDYITGDAKTTGNGLSVTGKGKLTFTYLGYEAGNSNYASRSGSTIFTNGASSVGATVTGNQLSAGLMDFAFGTSAPQGAVGLFRNDDLANPASKDYAIGYKKLSNTSYYVLFDDIAAGDRDFDDIGMRVDVAAVPVPAAGLLLVAGLGGLAALRRRRAAV